MKYSSGDFLGYAVLTFTLHLNVRAEGGVGCKDLQGRSYESGSHYVPGPEPCTFCFCDNGNPKWCKAFICKFPEEDCKSFRRGENCCDFICLDDTLSSISNEKSDGNSANSPDGSANYDIGLRSVASFVTAILSLSLLFFLIHRLRRRKIRVCVAGRQSRQLAEDQRNLGNMGYLERGGLPHGVPMDDMPCGGGYPLWKPTNNYFPRGEAPPPYEEAVAAARAEQALLSISPHTLLPLNFPSGYLPDSNSHSSVAIVTNSQGSLIASSPTPSNANDTSAVPLAVSSTSGILASSNTYTTNCHQLNQSDTSTTPNVGTSTTSFTTCANTYENLPVSTGVTNFTYQHNASNNDVQPISGSHTTISRNYRQHTTFPRPTGAFTISSILPSSDMSAHRTIPRTLATHTSRTRVREIINDTSNDEFLRLPSRSLSPQSLPRAASPTVSNINKENTSTSTALCKDNASKPLITSQIERQMSTTALAKTCDAKPSLNIANEINEDGSFESVACTCSMQTLPTLHDDADDYRSECENCKSATGSRYYLDNEDELVTSPHETMTLHRRPEEAASNATPQYYRTSLTLPTSTRQRTSNLLGIEVFGEGKSKVSKILLQRCTSFCTSQDIIIKFYVIVRYIYLKKKKQFEKLKNF